MVEHSLMYSMVGTRETVQRRVAEFLDRTKVDELMITAQIYDHAARVRSYEIAAEETNFTLGLTLLSQQLRRRSLIVLITDFIDTVTAELMVENLGRLSARHLVLFVTLQDPELRAIVDASPDATPASMETVARSVVAEEFRRERLIVFERLRRLGVQCLEAPYNRIGTDLINRYLAIKQREMI